MGLIKDVYWSVFLFTIPLPWPNYKPASWTDARRKQLAEVLWVTGSDVWRVMWVFLIRGLSGYMTAHCVAPQQSLMTATPDLVMDGLLGGGSGICLFGFAAFCVALSFFSRGISFSLRYSAISLSSSCSLWFTYSHMISCLNTMQQNRLLLLLVTRPLYVPDLQFVPLLGLFLRKPFMCEVIKWWLLRSIWLFRFQGPGIVQAGCHYLLGHLNRGNVL